MHLKNFPAMRVAAMLSALGLGLAQGQGQEAKAETLMDTAVTSLQDLVAEALKENRGIQAEAYRVEALHSTPNHRWYLDPPEIAVEFYQTPLSAFPNPLQDQMEIDYSLRQAFPFPGKIASRIEAEHKHAQMGEAESGAFKRKIIKEVKSRYYELYLLDRCLEYNRDDQSLMNRFVGIARSQYEVGMGSQADILRAQTELTNLKTDSISLAQTRRSMEGMLNAYLNRNLRRPIRVAKSLTPAGVDWKLEQILPVLKERHPELLAMKASVEMREAELSMAKREYLPDFMVGGAYKDMRRNPAGIHSGSPEDAWSLMVGMNVPVALWSLPKYKAGVVNARASLSQARHGYADLENRVIARAQEALLMADGNAELARITKSTLIPQSQQALESNLAAYQGGRGEFMPLLDAYRMRLTARRNAEMALMRLLVSEAELEEAIGLDLDEIKAILADAKGNGK